MRVVTAGDRSRTRTRGWRVDVVDGSGHAFLDAVDELTHDQCDAYREVHRMLAGRTRIPKKNVLVSYQGELVLATTLRARAAGWELATATCAPHLPIPCRPAFLEDALAVLHLPVLLPDYFGDAAADFDRSLVTPFEVFVAELHGFDFEAYWKSTRIWNTIRLTSRKTAHLQVRTDDLASLRWLIDRWESNWSSSPTDEIGAADDLREVWPYLLDQGLLTTVALVSPDGAPVAASGNAIDGDTSLGLVLARDTAWPSRGSLGTQIMVTCFEVARQAGLARVDMGGYHEHKRLLAPAGGVRHTIQVSPALLRGGRARRAVAAARRRARGLASGAETPET